jgi:hypothetical protein
MSRVIFVGAIAACAAACGNVTVQGTLGGRTLDVGGTAFGWIDATQYVVDNGGGAPVLEKRNADDVLLHLVFTQAQFDPSVDLRTLPTAERTDIENELARGDRLDVDVRRGNVIRPGDDISTVKNDGSLPPEVLPFVDSVDVQLGDEAIVQTDTYPDRAPRVGGDRTVKLHVDDTAPELVGKLTFTAAKAKGETDGFLEGTVTISFAIELLAERLAECNFDPAGAGVVDPCTLDDNGTAPAAAPVTGGGKP